MTLFRFLDLKFETETTKMPTVHLLDYVAGNVRSLVNAIEKLGWTVEWVKTPADVAKADVRDFHHYSRQLTKISVM